MSAYLIVEIDTTDPKKMAEYRDRVPALLARYGGRYRVRGGRVESLEGGWNPPRVVVVEFPDMARALEFYRSPDYAPLLELRLAAGRNRGILVEGVD